MAIQGKMYTFAKRAAYKLKRLGLGNWPKAYEEFIKWRIRRNYSTTLFRQYEDVDLQSLIMSNNSTPPIWILWWQGIDQMPDVVKICFASVKRHAGQHSIRFITKDNYREYLGELPHLEKLLELLRQSTMSYAHFADIIRTYLLFKYGGIWIDATVLLTADIDQIVTNLVFVSGRRNYKTGENDFSSQVLAKGKWTSYFICSCKGNPLFKLLNEMLVNQILKKGFFYDYFMMDYSFITIWERFSWARQMVAMSPSFPDKFRMLINGLNKPADETAFKALASTSPFLKLTYKHKWQEHTPSGELTYFGYLKRKYL